MVMMMMIMEALGACHLEHLYSPKSSHHTPSFIQLGTSKPEPWTGNPFAKILYDFSIVTKSFDLLKEILLPWDIEELIFLDELYPSYPNLMSFSVQLLLLPLQTIFLLSIPLLSILMVPIPVIAIYAGVFLSLNYTLCKYLNGSHLQLESSSQIITIDPNSPPEYWIYLNGVAAGKHWMQSNIDRLSLTFRRKVIGILNPTSGIVFDLIKCLIQRNFNYSTQETRHAYTLIKDALMDEKLPKVILILHSQGGIMGGLIVDSLLAEIPQCCLERLEIYTFGNAANHFNNPLRQSNNNHFSTTPHSLQTSGKISILRHIEHYANRNDFVANVGVLHFANFTNGFAGTVFDAPIGGHLLNQHYLSQWFPLNEKYHVIDNPTIMNSQVYFKHQVMPNPNDEDESEYVTTRESMENPVLAESVLIYSSNPDPFQCYANRVYKVKDFSRLWLYRNGNTPDAD